MQKKRLICIFLSFIMMLSSMAFVYADGFIYESNEETECPYSLNFDEIADMTVGGSYTLDINIVPKTTANGAVKLDIKDSELTTNSTYGLLFIRKLGSTYRLFVNGENKTAISTDMINAMSEEGIGINMKWDSKSGDMAFTMSNSKGSLGPYSVNLGEVTQKLGKLEVTSSGDASVSFIKIERALREFLVTVEPTVGGTVTGQGSYEENSEVTLTAVPDAEYAFYGWYENDNLLTKETDLTVIVDGDKVLKALFIKQNTVNVVAEPLEGGVVTGGKTVNDGESVTISANANEGYSFRGWYDGDVRITTEPEYTFTPEESVTYTAKFKEGEIATYEINAVSSNPAGGAVEGSGNYLEEEEVTLKAVAFSGYEFKGWYKDGELLSKDTEYTFVAEMSMEITAEFEALAKADYFEDFENITQDEWKTQYDNGQPWRHWNCSSIVEVDGNKKVKVAKGNTLVLSLKGIGFEAGNKYVLEFDIAPEKLLENTGWALYQSYFEGGAIGSKQSTMIYTNGANSYHLNSLETWLGSITYAEMEESLTKMWHVKWEWDSATGKITAVQGVNGGKTYTRTVTYNPITDTSKFGDFKFGAQEVSIYVDNVRLESYLAVKAEAGKYGKVYGSQNVRKGESVTLSAIPDEGCTFDGWYMNGYKVSDDVEWTFDVQASGTYTAKFINPNPKYTISVEATEGGSVSGEGIYPGNSTVKLIATPDTGYVFEGWYEDIDGEALSVENPWEFSAKEENDDKTYIAKFSNSGYTSLIDELKIYAVQDKKSEFTNKITLDNIEKMGFETGYEKDLDFEEVGGILWDEVKESSVNLGEDVLKDYNLYKISVAICLLNDEKTDNVTDLIDVILSEDSEFAEFFTRHIVTDSAKAYFTSLIKGKDIENSGELKAEMIDALILSAVKYPDGANSIKEIFDAYKSKSSLNLTTVSKKSSVWEGLANSDGFSDFDELLDEYNDLCGKKESNTTGGGGGGGSSTGTTGKNLTAGNGPAISVSGMVTNTQNKSISMKFEDLNSVPWAYESISRMYDEKIINGVSETEFRPDFSVTREAFVKMTVSALKLDTFGKTADFNDVVPGAWYEPYVAAAVENNIVNGMGDGLFGIGFEIKRQDMAVMIYNALKLSGKMKSENTNLAFADSDEISDYAKTAVAVLSNEGIINGVGDDMFDPDGIATRAQAAVIIDRAFEYLQ